MDEEACKVVNEVEMGGAVASGECRGRFVGIMVMVVVVHVGNGTVDVEVGEGACGRNVLECVARDEISGAWSGMWWYGVIER